MQKGVIDQQYHPGNKGNINRMKHYKMKRTMFSQPTLDIA